MTFSNILHLGMNGVYLLLIVGYLFFLYRINKILDLD